MTDMIEFQHDYLSIPARSLVPFFKDLSADDRQVEAARQMLLNWDFQLDKDSVEAGIYVAFERQLLDNIELLKVPEEASSFLNVGMKTTIDMLLAPDGDFGSDPIAGRDEFVLDTLGQAVATLREKFGRNMDDWVYGQAEYKHALLRHPLGAAVSEEIRESLRSGPRATRRKWFYRGRHRQWRQSDLGSLISNLYRYARLGQHSRHEHAGTGR